MTDEFYALLESRLTELVADLRYTHKPSGGLIAPQIISVCLPRPTAQVTEADEVPFVRWLVYEGEFAHRSPAPFTVLIDCCIYTDGSVADGNADISQLCMALGKIVLKPWFSPYKLRNRVRFILGDPETSTVFHGVQSHPYYACRLYLEFVVAKGHGGIEE